MSDEPIDRDAPAAEPAEAPEPAGLELAPEPPPSPELVEALRRERDELRDQVLRRRAEFENYKKRALKDRADLLKYQGERIFVDLLDIVDNFDLAMQHTGADEKFRQGVEMIHRMFQDLLGRWEVRGESAIGKPFDPLKSEAISKIPAPAGTAAGTVVNELKRAYFYKDKLLRVGNVVVADAPQPAAGEGASEDSDGAANV